MPLALGLSACGDDDPADLVRKSIGENGGLVTSHDGVLTILIQPGALSETVEIAIQPTDDPPDAFGDVYRVRPDVDLEIDADVTYRKDLPSDPERATVGAIRRKDFEDGNAGWTPLMRTELDLDNELVTGVDSELSLFYTLLDFGGGTTSSSTTTEPTETESSTTTSGSDTMESSDEETTTTTDGPLSHAADIQPIWNNNCGGLDCHGPGQRSPTLIDDGYDQIIDQFPISASVPYVTPSDAAASYLMHKLDGTHGVPANLGGCGCNGSGVTMPSGMEQLSQGQRDRVRRWIEEGADP